MRTPIISVSVILLALATCIAASPAGPGYNPFSDGEKRNLINLNVKEDESSNDGLPITLAESAKVFGDVGGD
ncbi:hypothetical protein BC827DRAFT_1267237 [Russula dissimulans]|nr:hypothetical protein BC827DRAFT_1267237 [Russula dissimulans]